MRTDPIVRLRRLLGEQWSPQWRVIEAIERACDEIERLRSAPPEEQRRVVMVDGVGTIHADAARYRWLNKKYDLLLRIGVMDNEYSKQTVALKCGPELDRWIDQHIEQERREPQSGSV